MNVIVTGGAGFIGSHIVDQLVDKGYKVKVIDNESSTVHERFYYNREADYYPFDITDYESTRNLYNDVDFVFHLAAESRIQPAIENPILAIKTNTLGTGTVLQCAREAGVKGVIYSSTSSAYGLRNKGALHEELSDDCLNPYSVSKVSGEKLCKMYSDLFGLSTVVFRYFNVYGPREPIKGPYAPVVGLFLRQRKDNQPLTIVGDGSQRRDFTHVYDVVDANIRAMDKIKEGTVYKGELINIGTGLNHSVLELAMKISDSIKFIPPRIGEAKETLANTTKAHKLLGWIPKGNILKYIQEELEKK
jgi:UDP-glucose 4-epimerase